WIGTRYRYSDAVSCNSVVFDKQGLGSRAGDDNRTAGPQCSALAVMKSISSCSRESSLHRQRVVTKSDQAQPLGMLFCAFIQGSQSQSVNDQQGIIGQARQYFIAALQGSDIRIREA